jgi:hypothetical protein
VSHTPIKRAEAEADYGRFRSGVRNKRRDHSGSERRNYRTFHVKIPFGSLVRRASYNDTLRMAAKVFLN